MTTKRRAGAGAAEDSLDSVTDPASQGTRIRRPDHADEAEEGDHRDGTPERGQGPRPPLGRQAEADAGEDETGDADPGSDPKGSEEPVVHGSGNRAAAGEEQHGGQDDTDSDRGNPRQLTAQIAMEQRRPARSRGASAWPRRRTP